MSNQSTVFYRLGRRLPGDFASVESAFIKAGFSEEEASTLAGRFDHKAGLITAPVHQFLSVTVRKIGGRFVLYEVVMTPCTDLRAMEALCEMTKRMAALNGQEIELVIFADIPNSAVH